MNKETRIFIWGVLLILFCSIGVGIHTLNLRNGITYTWYDWVLASSCLLGVVSGGVCVYKTVN